MDKKVLGILGGMGPAATADLYAKIVALTDAASDGEHIRTIIDSNVNIPDRTAAILSGGESPLEEMESALDNLACSGAEVIIIPCNTAHYFLPALKAYAAENYDAEGELECCAAGDAEGCAAGDAECCAEGELECCAAGDAECYAEGELECYAAGLHFVSMIEETAKACAARKPETAAILATKGTLESGLYQEALDANGVNYMVPDEAGKDTLMDVIYKGVKASASPESYLPKFEELLSSLKEQGADYFVLACTELPIAFAQLCDATSKSDAPTVNDAADLCGDGGECSSAFAAVDPTEVLATAAIRACGYQVKK